MFAEITTQLLYGPYGWCGNNYDGETSGFYLTPYVADGNYWADPHHMKMIRLLITMSQELYNKSDIIEVYTESGSLIQYSHHDLEFPVHVLFFELKEEYSILKIQFRKILGQTRSFGRAKMNTVLEMSVPVVELVPFGDDCPICLETLKEDKIITHCRHQFHMGCIWAYLKDNGLLKEKCERCKRNCRTGHAEKIKKFNCPVCREEIFC